MDTVDGDGDAAEQRANGRGHAGEGGTVALFSAILEAPRPTAWIAERRTMPGSSSRALPFALAARAGRSP